MKSGCPSLGERVRERVLGREREHTREEYSPGREREQEREEYEGLGRESAESMGDWGGESTGEAGEYERE
ncbi:hypothetical protein PAHAL_1G187000 [Panicum hallii]|jgi:hypothetical protein|uniref:Uncharacterized protein n=1 Tax=Panicum hallii TaxID=206008 RepID=A0A2T8KVQ3_9POAL|nr:hypothetical protein PAHAL_1G187000 [Panicum hallii]